MGTDDRLSPLRSDQQKPRVTDGMSLLSTITTTIAQTCLVVAIGCSIQVEVSLSQSPNDGLQQQHRKCTNTITTVVFEALTL